MKRILLTFLIGGLLAGGFLMIEKTQMPEAEAQNQSDAAWRKLADEAEIRRVIDEIDRTVDEKDWAKCQSYFAEDIDVDFTSLAGGKPARIKSAELVGGWRTNLYAEKKSQHMRSNYRFNVTGDRAEVFSKGYALNILPMKTGGDLWEVWGDYRHTLERSSSGNTWKVTGMTLAVAHARGNEKVRDFVPQK